MMTVLVGELVIRDLPSSFVVSSPCDRTVFVEQVSSQPFTAERGAPMAIAASSCTGGGTSVAGPGAAPPAGRLQHSVNDAYARSTATCRV
jgi:hypothetical protein